MTMQAASRPASAHAATSVRRAGWIGPPQMTYDVALHDQQAVAVGTHAQRSTQVQLVKRADQQEKIMAKLTEEQLAHARVTFLSLADGAPARQRIELLTQDEADCMFCTLEQLKATRTLDEITAFARLNNMQPEELLYSLAAKDASEFGQLWKPRNAQR